MTKAECHEGLFIIGVSINLNYAIMKNLSHNTLLNVS